MILFEIGTAVHPADPIAFRMLQIFFEQLGAPGRFIPCFVVVGILLIWHMARKDPWRVHLETLWAMLFESCLLAMPLLALGTGVARWNIHIPLGARMDGWQSNVVLSLGAGIYEEFVFRLVLMTVISVVLAKLLIVDKSLSNLLMVLGSATLFSLYHYLGNERFQMQSFVFRTAAGIYFAGLFITRGFGITAGCHIAYDVAIVALQAFAPH
ncbi:MAG TPA: CPBP family intramembrane glutamic endopeptidase [Tepidisphaeraceae bacterium]|nr:CPBP family intramembrane glutamic endopeptidase [Tepidisphaeraceae bacterium]